MVLAWLRLSPNAVTVLGTLLTFGSAVLIAMGLLRPAGIVLILGASLDIFDGALARLTGKSYSYGAFLDSTADRYSEAVVYLGMLILFLSHHNELTSIGILIALTGSYLVSYVRARAQSLGFSCEGGLFARPERVVVTVLGLLISLQALQLVVWVLAAVTNLTAMQRIYGVWIQARAQRHAARDDLAAVAEELRRSAKGDSRAGGQRS